MSKRAADLPVSPGGGLKNHSREEDASSSSSHPHDPAMGEFEDQFEDEFESEDEILEAGADGNPDPDSDAEEEDADGDTAMGGEDGTKNGQKKAAQKEEGGEVFLPSRRTLGKDEILEPDPSAYHLLHRMNVTWPCLSFDIMADGLGEERRGYPATTYLVTGTQADQPRKNEITVLKLSGLNKMQQDDDDEDDNDDDSDTEDDPILESRSIPTPSVTNRIRAAPHTHNSPEHLVASMHESGDILIHDIHSHLLSFDTPGLTPPPASSRPLATLKMHSRVEGYALDWSPLAPQGALLTGDNSGKIYHTTRTEAGGWKSDSKPFTGHTSSIEELQWSPAQPNIFASGSADGTVKIWDTRAKNHRAQLSVDVSSSDINVMSWCRRVNFLLATGADDGVWGVWDLRTFPSAAAGGSCTPTAQFSFHQQPVTSIEFHPGEDSIVAVASADNTVTLWDLSVEMDDEESRDTGGVEDVPPQLMFVHYMKEVKEVHWHPQIPGAVVATGGDGFNVFKTISV